MLPERVTMLENNYAKLRDRRCRLTSSTAARGVTLIVLILSWNERLDHVLLTRPLCVLVTGIRAQGQEGSIIGSLEPIPLSQI